MGPTSFASCAGIFLQDGQHHFCNQNLLNQLSSRPPPANTIAGNGWQMSLLLIPKGVVPRRNFEKRRSSYLVGGSRSVDSI
jgi:hypothetical protein